MGLPVELNATQGSLLGFLHDGPQTGWDLLQAVSATLSRFWSVTPSHVYRELGNLERRKLVRARAARSAGQEAVRDHQGRREGLRGVDRAGAGSRSRSASRSSSRCGSAATSTRRRSPGSSSVSAKTTSAGSRCTPTSRSSGPVTMRTPQPYSSSACGTSRRSSTGWPRCRSSSASSACDRRGRRRQDPAGKLQAMVERVAVLAPMVSELKPVVRAFGLTAAATDGEPKRHTGRAGTVDVVATMTGIGTRTAAETTERVLAAEHGRLRDGRRHRGWGRGRDQGRRRPRAERRDRRSERGRVPTRRADRRSRRVAGS